MEKIYELYASQIDKTLLEKNLSLSVEERFQQWMALQRFAEELKKAGSELRREHD